MNINSLMKLCCLSEWQHHADWPTVDSYPPQDPTWTSPVFPQPPSTTMLSVTVNVINYHNESWLSDIMIQSISTSLQYSLSPQLDNNRVMVIVWRLRGNIIRTALCWIVWYNVHSEQHTYVSSSYRSNRLYAVRRGGWCIICLVGR